jgi:hypothetical protein
MFRNLADNLRSGACLTALLALLPGGCASSEQAGAADSKDSALPAEDGGSRPRTAGNIADGDYLAQAWATGLRDESAGTARRAPKPMATYAPGAQLQTLRKDAPPPTSPESSMRDTASPLRTADASAKPGAEEAERGGPRHGESGGVQSTWSLVLGTFTEGDHVAAAQRMIAEMQKIAPQVQGLRVHPGGKGSMVVFGQYAGREDPKAAADKTWLKSLQHQNRPVFPRIALTHLDLRSLQADLHPFDLHTARRQHPKVHPLYTLDVAMWDDFDSGKLTYEQIRRSAEGYAQQLRNAGYEAYFYHDDRVERSVVTVGLFDRTAINQTSGLFTSVVTDMMKQFPQRMVNGEPMSEFKDRFRPEMGVKPQTPVLVEVPDM